jgi:hypothetical protein
MSYIPECDVSPMPEGPLPAMIVFAFAGSR